MFTLFSFSLRVCICFPLIRTKAFLKLLESISNLEEISPFFVPVYVLLIVRISLVSFLNYFPVLLVS